MTQRDANPNPTCPGGIAHAARRAPGGFTLLELLLAVSITGVIALVLFASLSLAFDMRRQGQRQLSDRGAARAAVGMLADDLLAAPRPGGTIAEPWESEDETGRGARDADELAFVTAGETMPLDEPLADLRRVRWQLEPDPALDDRYQLVRLVTPNLLAGTTPEPTRQVIARRVIALDLSFDDGSGWIDQWNSADQGNGLPRAVRITLTIEPEHRRGTAPGQARPLSVDDDELLTVRRVVVLPASRVARAASRQ